MLEIVKIGGPVLAFAVVLLWVTLRDKERMAIELTKDKERVLDALLKVTDVVANNTIVMRGVQSTMNVCLRVERAERVDPAGNGG